MFCFTQPFRHNKLQGICSFVEILKGCTVRERLGTFAAEQLFLTWVRSSPWGSTELCLVFDEGRLKHD